MNYGNKKLIFATNYFHYITDDFFTCNPIFPYSVNCIGNKKEQALQIVPYPT